MTEKQLTRIAKQFTKGLLSKRPSKMMCYAVCAPLQSYLHLCGCNTELIEGELMQGEELWNHFWLKLPNGQILDPTANQFNTPTGEEMPPIYIGEKPEWYKISSALQPKP